MSRKISSYLHSGAQHDFMMERIHKLEEEKLGNLGHLALTVMQAEELVSASLGLTRVQSGHKYGISAESIKTSRERILRAMNASNMALAVRIGLEQMIIETEPSEVPLYHPLTTIELEAVLLGSLGVTNGEAEAEYGVGVNRRVTGIIKLGASNMPHATRRLYEVGILKRGEFGTQS